MTYLVLARKWRPRNFDTLVGQEHVVRALSQALSTQRLHHAWLFTGTRGVGKTTLSRILAKALNCQQGITPTPCGVCAACTGIDADRYVDYLELDAASNRGVEEMTKLLEQAVYAPSAGRFKVYMIDEVHMLTGHAFNAMLKTLEEPPPHVKFILATTDPQKIPVTVLSRCLQFNLKQMPPESIAGHLTNVLAAEAVPAEPQALRLIGQAARGSMRDALSLTDQAIAYSGGHVSEEAVRSMLGAIDQRYLVRLLDALAQADGPGMIAVADELAARSLSYNAALGDLASLLSQIAMAQRIPGLPTEDAPLAADIRRLAGLLPPDGVQLFYSIALHSRPELALAPDEYAGFVMACLRMLAFATDPAGGEPVDEAGPAQARAAAGASASAGRATPAAVPAASAAVAPVAAATQAPSPSTGEVLSGPAAARAALAGLRGGAGAGRPRPAAPAGPAAPASAGPTRTLPTASPASAPASAEPLPEATPAGAASAPAPGAHEAVPSPSPSAGVPAATADQTSVASPVPALEPATVAGSAPTQARATPVADAPEATPSSVRAPAPSASTAPAATTPASREPAATAAPASHREPTAAPAEIPSAFPAVPERAVGAGRSAGLAVSRPTAVAPASMPVDLPFPERTAASRAPASGATAARVPASGSPAPRSTPTAAAPSAMAAPQAGTPPSAPRTSPPSPRTPPTAATPAPTARTPSRASGTAPRSAPPPWETLDDEAAFGPPDMDIPPWAESENPAPPDWPSESSRASAPGAGAAARNAPGRPAVPSTGRSAPAAARPERHAEPSAVSEAPRAAPPARVVSGDANAPIVLAEPWPQLVMRLPLRGMSAELARQAEWSGVEGGTIVLTVPAQPMAQGPSVERLRAALIEYFGRPLQLRMQVGETGTDTAHAVAQSERDARQREAESAIEADPFVQALVQQFGGEIIPGSIKPA